MQAPKPSEKPMWKRWQDKCRDWLARYDGLDPSVKGLGWKSDVGKVSRISGQQHDQRSLHYIGESKWSERVAKWLLTPWLKVTQIAAHNSKAALLMIGGPDGVALHIITPERHAELLGYEREVEERLDDLQN